jgi:hypothetical protein
MPDVKALAQAVDAARVELRALPVPAAGRTVPEAATKPRVATKHPLSRTRPPSRATAPAKPRRTR